MTWIATYFEPEKRRRKRQLLLECNYCKKYFVRRWQPVYRERINHFCSRFCNGKYYNNIRSLDPNCEEKYYTPMRRAQNNPETIIKRGISIKAALANPELRKKRSAISIEVRSRPEVKEK